MRPSESQHHDVHREGHHFGRRKVWEDFRNDEVLRAVYRITEDEMNRLHTVFLVGEYREKRDLVDALKLMRRGFRS